MTHVALDPFAAAALPESPDPAAASAAAYATEVVELLSGLLLRAGAGAAAGDRAGAARRAASRRARVPSSLARTLQVQGIWFQLLSIAEQNAAMRRRRQIEAERGHEQLRGTFAQVITRRRRDGVPAADVQRAAGGAPRPAGHHGPSHRGQAGHRAGEAPPDLPPAGRAGVAPLDTAGARRRWSTGLRNDIELLWLTGELRLAKPTVPQEVYWGLHFFNETLFESVPDLIDKVERRLEQHYPGESFTVPAFFQFGSWIGGDRDGNPFVTNDVTRSTLLENRLAAVRRYHRRLGELVRALSITERVGAALRPLPTGARAGAGGHRRGRGDREPQSGRDLPAIPRRRCSAGWK